MVETIQQYNRKYIKTEKDNPIPTYRQTIIITKMLSIGRLGRGHLHMSMHRRYSSFRTASTRSWTRTGSSIIYFCLYFFLVSFFCQLFWLWSTFQCKRNISNRILSYRKKTATEHMLNNSCDKVIKSSSNRLTSNGCLQMIGDNRNKTSDTSRSLLRFSVSVSVTVDLYNTGKRLQNHRNIGNALVHAIGDNGSTHTHRETDRQTERERRIQTRTHRGHKTAESVRSIYAARDSGRRRFARLPTGSLACCVISGPKYRHPCDLSSPLRPPCYVTIRRSRDEKITVTQQNITALSLLTSSS